MKRLKIIFKEGLRHFIKGILKILCMLLFRVKKIGEENIPKEGACVICPNHVSNWDPLIMVACTNRKIRMMAKAELYKNPLLRLLSYVFGMFPVKRGSGDIEAIKNSLKVLKSNEVLGLYPEGTRNGMEKGIKPKNGAVLIATRAGVPIIPVGIQGSFKPFSQVKVNYGKPVYYNKNQVDIQNKEQIDKLTENLMDYIIILRDEKV